MLCAEQRAFGNRNDPWENDQEKRSRSEKAILGALGEFRGILGAALGIQKLTLGMRIPFSEWHLTT